MSEENRTRLVRQGDDYVVVARRRSLSAAHTKKVTGTQAWQDAGRDRTVAAGRVGGRRLILRYGPGRRPKLCISARTP